MHELTPALDPNSSVPMYEQLYRFISREIIQGRLAGSTRLPSRRALSRHLGISEQTVSNAFDLLKAEGFLRTEPRRGFIVEEILPLTETQSQPQTRAHDVPSSILYDFSPQSTDTRLFPYKAWTRLIKEALLDEPELMKRGSPKGEYSLRAALSSFLYQFRGVICHADNLIISSGVDQLLGTIGALFGRPVKIACEDPGYPEAFRSLRRTGHLPLPLPLDEQGVVLNELELSGAELLYITPAHQFPTGTSMPASRRAELLHWAQQKDGRYIIEDDYDSEFRYTSRPLPALQGIDPTGKVIYLSTFSRSLAPGLRIAYMALPPDLCLRYDQLHLRSGETVSRFEQKAMARLLSEGHYARHLRRASGVYQKRCKALCDLLGSIPGSFLKGQEAGLHFLFGIKGRHEQELTRSAAASGIPLHGLSGYCQSAVHPSALVLGFGGLEDDQLAAAVAALRHIWSV